MPLWAAFALLVISFIIRALFSPKPQVPKPATFEEFEFPQIDEGTAQPVLFGQRTTPSWFVLGAGNFSSKAIKGKGGKK